MKCFGALPKTLEIRMFYAGHVTRQTNIPRAEQLPGITAGRNKKPAETNSDRPGGRLAALAGSWAPFYSWARCRRFGGKVRVLVLPGGWLRVDGRFRSPARPGGTQLSYGVSVGGRRQCRRWQEARTRGGVEQKSAQEGFMK